MKQTENGVSSTRKLNNSQGSINSSGNNSVDNFGLKGIVTPNQYFEYRDFTENAKAGLEARVDLKEAASSLKTCSKDRFGLSIDQSGELNGTHEIRLIHIKGQRNMQVRLVPLKVSVFNPHDCFVLVTNTQIVQWNGRFSNIMKKAKATEVAAIVQKWKEFKCRCREVKIVSDYGKTLSPFITKFLENDGEYNVEKKIVDDNDYEKASINICKISEVKLNKDSTPSLIFRDDISKKLLKRNYLESNKAYLLDFGSEIYAWIGKDCGPEIRQAASMLALEAFEKLELQPVVDLPSQEIFNSLGLYFPDKKTPRPSFVTVERLTERSEHVVFRKKFINWPDPLTVTFKQQKVEVKSFKLDKAILSRVLDTDEKIDWIIDGMVINRGQGGIDIETGFQYSVSTEEILTYHLRDKSYNLLTDYSRTHFFSSEAYLVEWGFNYKRCDVRSLKGDTSSHDDNGRESLIIFYWQGKDCSVSDKGTSAFMTAHHSKNRAHQIRVTQESNIPSFYSVFNGELIIHLGKIEEFRKKDPHLYIIRGSVSSELFLVEVSLNSLSLRSKGQFFLVSPKSRTIFWFIGSSCVNKSVIQNKIDIINKRFSEIFNVDYFKVEEQSSSFLSREFSDILNINGPLKMPILSAPKNRLRSRIVACYFCIDSSSMIDLKRLDYQHAIVKNFEDSLVEVDTFPLLQSHLYGLNQPALVFVLTYDKNFLWHGWIPTRTTNEFAETSEHSSPLRDPLFLRIQKAVLQAIPLYLKDSELVSSDITMIHAGFEPKEFIHLFPHWELNDEVISIQSAVGRKSEEVEELSTREISLNNQPLYSLAILRTKPLPEGVDPLIIEDYLDEVTFQEIFKMAKDEFHALPKWKKLQMKKANDLF